MYQKMPKTGRDFTGNFEGRDKGQVKGFQGCFGFECAFDDPCKAFGYNGTILPQPGPSIVIPRRSAKVIGEFRTLHQNHWCKLWARWDNSELVIMHADYCSSKRWMMGVDDEAQQQTAGGRTNYGKQMTWLRRTVTPSSASAAGRRCCALLRSFGGPK